MNQPSTVIFSLLCCLSLNAQSNLASVSGLLMDPSEKAITNAEVHAQNADTRAVRTASSNSGGHFEIRGLTPGEYTIEVAATGFATTQRTVRLEVGQNMRLDMSLTIGDAKTSV